MPPNALVVSGTDTSIGKTVFSAMLTLALDADYWKPINTGVPPDSDPETVRALTGLSSERILPSRYEFCAPLSPHRAAQLEGKLITTDALRELPKTQRPLIIEGAGGLMVPLTPDNLQIDLFQQWQAPVILCARTALGTINHTLLSIEALRHRGIPLLGVAFIGDAIPDSEDIISRLGGVLRLGRLPKLETLSREDLLAAFDANFRSSDFVHEAALC